jgi:hypothetical protein
LNINELIYFFMLIGYARVSTLDQNPNLQTDALSAAGCEKIYIEKISGLVAERPELNKLKEQLRKDDSLVVWRLDRLGRSLKDLIEWVNYLDAQGVAFKSIQEGFDTSTSGGRLVFHMFGALAEFERNLIKERTMAGLTAARSRGRVGGRPKKLNEAKQKMARQMYDAHNPITEICEALQISKPTLYKYLAV